MKNQNVEDVYPLAPVQEGVLFHSLLEAGSGVYHAQFTCVVQGLQVATFKEAWQRIMDRHPVLRTAFVWKSVDRPMQIVGRRIRVSIALEDWRGLDSADQIEKYEHYLREDRERGFDVGKAPLLRLALFQLADETYRFVWSHHHLLLDGWASAIVLKEVFVCYDALLRGSELSLPPQRPFRDYIAWLRRQDMAKAEAYWRHALAGFTTPTPFAIDRKHTDQSGDGGYSKQTAQLSPGTTARLQEIARHEQLTLNTVVQGAWALLLSRYTRLPEVVFGSVVSGRPPALSGVEAMVGLFINTLPVRVKIDDRQATLEWLRLLQTQQAEMREYEYSPLVEIQRWSEVAAGAPLFESYVVFQNYPIDEDLKDKIDGLVVSEVESIERSSYPLVVAVTPGRKLTLQLFFELDRFEGPAIAKTLAHLVTLLEEIAADPERRLGELSMLTAKERQQLLEWNVPETGYLNDVSIHQLFESQAASTPDATALVFRHERLTYADLNSRANRVAHRLRELGVKPEVRVGLCVERSAEMIVGLLGILKAGGVYVPLDAQHPPERLQYMVQDAGARVLVTQSHLRYALPAHDAKIVFLDADREFLRGRTDNRSTEISGDNLAYIIYTSGSTGTPKGVGVSHEVAVNHFIAMRETFKIEAGDRVLQFASLSFDVSLEQILTTLLTGATLVLRGDELWSAVEFADALREDKLTVVNFPTAYWHRLAQESGEFDGGHYLKLAISGGDTMLPEAVRVWQNGPLGAARLINAYGPTEAVITATFFEVPAQFCDDSSYDTVPIGRAVAHRSLYILDDGRRLVPAGIAGELHIGGPLLARGYLNQPELTAQKFVPDPFSQTPGARLYRTGDLARRLANGNIEFLGRIDQQVKIRGYRVEPGEVEAALSSHPAVREVAVLAQPATDGEKELVAYISIPDRHQPATGEWRDYLKERLPEYMVPAAFVMLDELPLTPNGKVDRHALAAVKPASQSIDDDYVGPSNEIEACVAAIWSEVLEVERIGLDDDFFALGGHSLMATQVVSRVRERLKVTVPLRSLFDAPTVRGMAAVVAGAIEAKTKAETAPGPIKPVPRHQSLPLSFAQQRLWFLDQLEPGSSLYNIAAAVRLDGRLNIPALNSAFDEIIRRHESLRTTFTDSAGEPQQVIAAEQKLTLPVFDLGPLPASEGEAEASLRAAEEAQRPFDLSAGPLLRATLLRLAGEEHILLLTMHHIISDGWSMGVLVKEVATLYAAFATGKPSPLPEPSIQYADYAVWQREWLQGALLEKQIEYWKRRLDGVQPLELPADRPRPPVQTYAGARYDFELPQELTRRLQALGQSAGATLFMTLMAAFQTLLHRYTGEEDICVGTPIAGRTRLDTESLIGFFVNTLVLRTTVASTSSFKQVLSGVREAVLEAHTHQDVPFDRLVEILQPARDLSRTPFFQVIFALQEAVVEKVELPELKLSPVKADKTTAKVDLTLLMEETAEGLKGSFEFNTDLFDRATVERLTGHFRQLLEAVSDNAEERVSELPLLTTRELQQLLYQWNDTTTDYPRDKCVHQLFELQVERTPDAVAVISEDQQLTYRELNDRANQLAHYLQSSGAGPESPIGIMIERSVELVVGLLGILKAGGAYVPLDPGYPRERLAFMIADAGIHHLLTQAQFVGQLPEQLFKPGSLTTSLDADWTEISRESTENPASKATPENLAYVMYTSGSTGIPKGVSVNHRSVVRLVRNTNYVDLNSDHTFLQMAPVSFDASTFEIWGSLLNGARLALMVPGAVPSLEGLGESLRRYDVTTLWLTAGLFHLMVDQQLDNLQMVKQLLAGGDVLSVPHVKKFLRHVAGGKLINGYGPTENTTFTCCHLMTDASRIGASVPIGCPISNTQVYVLDRNLRPVPIGVVGELYTSGDGLSRGYLNRPELTAEKFIPCPFGDKPGARLYRTGDLVRWVAGGQIEFLGRRDHQVKLRGFRIELEEIEATLRQQRDVRDAVVVVQEKTPGDKRLVAYVTAEGEAVLTADDLRSSLKEQLPKYMVPHAFVLMDEFPLTPNGKIDRRALPAPATQSEGRETFVAAQTDTEKVVTQTWTNILGVEPIGVNDNFFELGGHSLQATRVVSQLREAFQVELPLRGFFEAPTVAGLAALIDESRHRDEQAHPERIVRCSREGHLPLSFAQERLWFFDQLRPFNSLYNIPVAVSLKGQLDTSTLERTLNEIIRRHETLRTTFAQSDGAPRQVIAPELKLTLAVVELGLLPAAERETEVHLRATEDAKRPFDLSVGPLLRATLLRLYDDEHVLLLTMHHIISDGWSMGVLVREVGALYEAFAAGDPSPLPEPSIQYADHAVWQRKWLQGPVLENQLDYWKRQLARAETLQLRTERQRPDTRRYRGARCPFELTAEVSQQLNALSLREGATLFMTLLTGFQILLHHHSGQNDISVGTDIANRNRSEIERLIGFFINQLVLRTDLSGNPTFVELLQRVRATTLDAYAHQDVPFELLVDALRVERSLKQSPLFQVKLVLQNTPQSALALSGLTLRPLEVDYVSAKFDLTLLLAETVEGIRGYFEYDTDLFSAATVNRFAKHLVALLGHAVTQPELPLATFKQRLEELDRHEQTMERNRRADLNRRKLKNIKPRRMVLKPEELVRREALDTGGTLPLVIRPINGSVDLVSWVEAHRAQVEADVVGHGAILFRGFEIDLQSQFEKFAQGICTELFAENGEHSRSLVGGKVYTPVFYPPDQHLLWHNENSFNYHWPSKIIFACVQPADEGGETPIVDSSLVFERLDAKIKERFVERQIMYVRNYSAALGLDWQTVFRTNDRAVVEQQCRAANMEFEWKKDGQLRTRCVRPAVVRHVVNDRPSWFNQAQHWHVSCLGQVTRDSVRSLFREEDFPRHCYYGDGSPIEDSVMAEILNVYRELEVSFAWRKGDILVLDNLLTAHARNRFKGERKLLVAMGDMRSYADVAHVELVETAATVGK
jgi:amino acid adenylation domain-containing protein